MLTLALLWPLAELNEAALWQHSEGWDYFNLWRTEDRKTTCTWGVIPRLYAAVKSGAKSKQLAFCSARQSFSLHSCDVVHARTETTDDDSDNDEHKWNCITALPSSSQTKACDSLISQHKENMGENKGIFGSLSTLCVCERGNSIGGDFRCGCTFITGHFKASLHACVAHHGWLMSHYLAVASLFSIVWLWVNFMIWPNSDAECGRLKMLPFPSLIEERRPLWGETDVGRDV